MQHHYTANACHPLSYTELSQRQTADSHTTQSQQRNTPTNSYNVKGNTAQRNAAIHHTPTTGK
jgi:hypothetical protein